MRGGKGRIILERGRENGIELEPNDDNNRRAVGGGYPFMKAGAGRGSISVSYLAKLERKLGSRNRHSGNRGEADDRNKSQKTRTPWQTALLGAITTIFG